MTKTIIPAVIILLGFCLALGLVDRHHPVVARFVLVGAAFVVVLFTGLMP